MAEILCTARVMCTAQASNWGRSCIWIQGHFYINYCAMYVVFGVDCTLSGPKNEECLFLQPCQTLSQSELSCLFLAMTYPQA